MIRQTALAVLLVLVWVVTACSSSSQRASDLNYPIAAIDQSVSEALSMGIQGFSENRREITSKPFQVRQSDEAKHTGYRERGVAKVTILGDRRPYSLEVEVSIQKGKIRKDLADISYSFERYDQGLASKLLTDILTILQKKMRNRNAIDDMKAF